MRFDSSCYPLFVVSSVCDNLEHWFAEPFSCHSDRSGGMPDVRGWQSHSPVIPAKAGIHRGWCCSRFTWKRGFHFLYFSFIVSVLWLDPKNQRSRLDPLGLNYAPAAREKVELASLRQQLFLGPLASAPFRDGPPAQVCYFLSLPNCLSSTPAGMIIVNVERWHEGTSEIPTLSI